MTPQAAIGPPIHASDAYRITMCMPRFNQPPSGRHGDERRWPAAGGHIAGRAGGWPSDIDHTIDVRRLNVLRRFQPPQRWTHQWCVQCGARRLRAACPRDSFDLSRASATDRRVPPMTLRPARREASAAMQVAVRGGVDPPGPYAQRLPKAGDDCRKAYGRPTGRSAKPEPCPNHRSSGERTNRLAKRFGALWNQPTRPRAPGKSLGPTARR